jgi:type IV pilus assembly protein PilM
MFGLGKEKGFVGLDIGSHAIKVVELKAKGKKPNERFEVARIGYEPLPHEAIVEGTIIDSPAVTEAIKAVFEKNKITNKNVIISLSGNSIIVKKISLPSMETQELAESIIWEAKHNIPYPYEETNVDYAILKPHREEGQSRLEILLVAAKKDKIASYSNVVHQAQKNLDAVEVDLFALQNTLEANYPEILADKTVAGVNIGAHITNIIISEQGIPQIFRDLSIGGFYFTENMRKSLGVSFDEAEKLLRSSPVKDIEPAQAEAVISLNIKELLNEVDKTFSFYLSENRKEKKIDQIFICGGLANLKNLTNNFEERFGTKTIILDPFRNIYFDEKKLDPTYYQEMATFFGIATGLATRHEEK